MRIKLLIFLLVRKKRQSKIKSTFVWCTMLNAFFLLLSPSHSLFLFIFISHDCIIAIIYIFFRLINSNYFTSLPQWLDGLLCMKWNLILFMHFLKKKIIGKINDNIGFWHRFDKRKVMQGWCWKFLWLGGISAIFYWLWKKRYGII